MTHISGYDRSQILLLPEVVAGESALRRSAIIEAVTHLTRGIELISSLPAGPDRDGTELHLQLALGTVMWAAKGQSAPETLRVLFPRSWSPRWERHPAGTDDLFFTVFGRSEHVAKIFTEQMSGAVTDRPALHDALEFARSGDTLIVWKLDRLARSMKQLIETIENLRVRGIGFRFRSLTEALDTAACDMNTPTSNPPSSFKRPIIGPYSICWSKIEFAPDSPLEEAVTSELVSSFLVEPVSVTLAGIVHILQA